MFKLLNLKSLTPYDYTNLLEVVQLKKVKFVKAKIFENGAKQITIKYGYAPIDEENSKKREYNKKVHYVFNTYKPKSDILKEISKETNLFNYEEKNKEYEEKAGETEIKWLRQESIRVSVARTRKEIYDLFLCNDFEYFITVTFNADKVSNRYDDDETRKKFSLWLNNLKKDIPNATYIAVPEHHKKGGIHFHIVMGNVTLEQLKLVDSGKRVKDGETAGDIIFNVKRWRNGFSTATKIRNVNATKLYLLKYISKQQYDILFFGKKRYWASRNLKRPEVRKFTFEEDYAVPLSPDMELVYRDKEREYTVFENEKFIHL